MLVLKNMIILNGHKNMKPVAGKAIIIDEEKIMDIINEDDVPDGVEAIDLKGRYLLPGLINLHVHIPSSGKPSKKKLDYEKIAKLLKLGIARFVVRKMCEGIVKTTLRSGTTTIRAVGGVLDFDTSIRNKINEGNLEGPRILTSD